MLPARAFSTPYSVSFVTLCSAAVGMRCYDTTAIPPRFPSCLPFTHCRRRPPPGKVHSPPQMNSTAHFYDGAGAFAEAEAVESEEANVGIEAGWFLHTFISAFVWAYVCAIHPTACLSLASMTIISIPLCL